MDEDDHLMQCAYCDVNNYLYSPGHHRVLLPHNPANPDIFYAPYLRFKGSVFLCRFNGIDFRFLDITRAGSAVDGLPGSLGLRPQSMKLTSVSAKTTGHYLPLSLETEEFLKKAGRIINGTTTDLVLFQAFIGETVSIIYLPLYIRSGKLFDAIEKKVICEQSNFEDIRAAFHNPHGGWAIRFLPTLCPSCGWKLDGERDSVVLTCANCSSGWQVQNDRFIMVDVGYVPAIDDNIRYLPFWKLEASFSEPRLQTFSDFMRFTRQTKVPMKEWQHREMAFWSPGFKIRPKNLLSLSSLFTLNQMALEQKNGMPRNGIYPVTLPVVEAMEMIRIILANTSIDKIRILPRISDSKFKIKKYTLIYLPFKEYTNELVQEQIPVAINRNALRFGRQF